MRPRLRRLVSLWRPNVAPAPLGAPQERRALQERSGRDVERRIEDAQRRLKQSVPPRVDP